MAQRIAKLIEEKARQGITVEVPMMHHALQFATWDTITYSQEHLGWSDKVFRIKSMKMGSVPDGEVRLLLQEESSASYEWNSGEASEIDAAPDTNLPDPFTVAPPGVPTITESKYITRSGDGVKAKATIAWTASTDAFLKEYQAEYKLTTATTWLVLPRTSATTIDVEDIAPGTYHWRVKAINTLGVSSSYTEPKTQVIHGLLDPPPEPQNLTISTIGGLAILRWDEYTGNDTLDVRIGGKVVFRHSPDLTADWPQSTTIAESVPGSHTSATLPLKPGKYLAKACDSSGTLSEGTATVTTAQATALEYANVASLTEHPAFSGAKTDCVASDGVLSLAGAGLFSEIPLLSEVSSVAAYGGVASTGTYEFSGAIDLGTAKRVRATSHVKASVVNVLDRIGDRTELISTWASFSGSNSADGDARVYVRTTDDDPAGSPTWSAWQRLDSAELHCRAIDPKLVMDSFDPAYNIRVSELSINIDEVA